MIRLRPNSRIGASDSTKPRLPDPSRTLREFSLPSCSQRLNLARASHDRERRRQDLGRPLLGSRLRGPEWVITTFSFTLNRLRHPNSQEAEVLSASVREATKMMPTPGDKFRVTGLDRGLFQTGHAPMANGMLPPSQPARDPSELHVSP
jgi:hypothetical protein